MKKTTTNEMKVASGILNWDSGERRSNRYGFIFLDRAPFEGLARAKVLVDRELLERHRGARVHLTVKITKGRVSTHVGDAALGIRPPREAPRAGSVIDLGVGILAVEPAYFDAQLTTIGLVPGDGRSELWLDPRKLYILHDQTVDVFIEPTTDDFTPAPDLPCATAGVFDNGDGESLQVKKTGDSIALEPVIEKLGQGMFAISPPVSKEGEFGRPIAYREAKRKGN